MATWKAVDSDAAKILSDARRQLHHAAQLATAFGISFLEKQPDDGHTNLEWIESESALTSNESNGTRVSVRVPDLTLLIGEESFPLIGRTMNEGAKWIRSQLSTRGFGAERYTLERHYQIPDHKVGKGGRFNAHFNSLRQLSNWFANGALMLERIHLTDERSSDVRCWPHHFDIAMLIIPEKGKSIGVGLEPGDVYYEEPYFYVNMYPPPMNVTLPPTLLGRGLWHTNEWIGAVLPGSRVTDDANGQETQVRDFLSSAIDTSARLITR